MQFEYSSYVLPLCAAALVSFIVAAYALTRRSTRCAQSLALLSLAIALWALGYALEIAGANLETKYFWGVVQYIGIAFVPYLWFLFAYHYSDTTQELPRWVLPLLALVPVLTILFAFTTRWHGLIWREYHINQREAFSALGVTYGPWFWVHFIYSYVLLFIGTILLVRVLANRKGMYRGQAVSLLIALLAPWIGNALYLTGNSLVPYLDLTPFAFTITVTALTWAVFGFHLVDTTPLARDHVIDSMRDGMVVLDRRGLVLDLNPAAERMIGVTLANAVGKSTEVVFAPWQDMLERYRGVSEIDEQVVVGSGNTLRRFQLRISTLQDKDQIAGRVILIHAQSEDNPVSTQTAKPARLSTNKAPHTPAARLPIPAVIVNFFRVPPITDFVVPPRVDPSWYQTRERIFTLAARLAAVVGTASLLLVLPGMFNVPGALGSFVVIITLLWVLGLVRSAQYEVRAGTFLFLIYGLSFVETINFGFSVESFIFFMSLVVIATVLTSRRSALGVLVLSLLTIASFALLIGAGTFVPFAVAAGDAPLAPTDINGGLNSLTVFAGGALAVFVAITILLESLQTSWQKERQSANLLQEERDLLDRRVTERTRDLAEANTKYQTLVEQLPVVVYRDVLDEWSSNIYISPQVETLLGYAAQAWQEDPQLWHKLIHPQDVERAIRSIEEAVSAGYSNAEYRLRTRDGRIVWVRDDAKLVRDKDGNPQFIQGVLEDITTRKQAEIQVRQLSQAVEQSGSAIVITDIEGNIEYVNPQFTNATGYTVQEAIGQNPRILKSGKQSTAFYKGLWQSISNGKTWRGVFHNRRKDGTLYWESATINPMLDEQGKITHYLAIKEDITRQKEVEEALQQSNRQQSLLNSLLSLSLEGLTLDEMLEHALEIILTIPWLPVQPRGGIFLVQDQPGILVLKTQRNLDTPLLSLCARVPFGHCLCGLAAAHAKIQFADCVDERHKNRYEEIPPHGHYNVPILSREEVLGVLVLYLEEGRTRDTRETAFLEAVANVLASMIRDKQAEQALALARDQALEASTFKSHLLSRVSHEMRTPLSGVLGYAQLMQLDEFGALNESQREAAALIATSARYLNFVIQDLLDDAQIKAKTILLHNKSFIVAEFLSSVEAVTTVLAHTKGLSFRTEIAPELPEMLVGDEQRLQQILVNLVGNAVKFTKKGEIYVRLYRPAKEQWAMQVIDTGTGIPQEAQIYIFEPFRQVNNPNIREQRGTGLGLSITKQLVELMGGQITLESEMGKGSVFTVTLPLISV